MFFYTRKILTLAVMVVLTVGWPALLTVVAMGAWFAAISLPVMALTDVESFMLAGPLVITAFWLVTVVVGIGSVELLVRACRAWPYAIDAIADEWNARPPMRYVR